MKSRFASHFNCLQTSSVAQPATYPMGTGIFPPMIKLPEREDDHSPPSVVEVKNAWSSTSIPQYVFMVSCLIKYRDKFTCIFKRSSLALRSYVDSNSIRTVGVFCDHKKIWKKSHATGHAHPGALPCVQGLFLMSLHLPSRDGNSQIGSVKE